MMMLIYPEIVRKCPLIDLVHVTHTALPDSPISLQVVSITTTTAMVTWSAPPFDPTNIIAFYNLTLMSDDTFGSRDIFEVMQSVQPFQYTFTGLEEHVNYTCDVISVGVFNTFSPPISINFTTLEAGKLFKKFIKTN